MKSCSSAETEISTPRKTSISNKTSCPTVESGQAGRAESCQGCPNANICKDAKPDENIEIIHKNLENVKLTIAILSGKGGVGKSTISMNIASSLARKGYKTLLLDFDISGPSIPRLTNTMDEFIRNPDEKFKPIPVRSTGLLTEKSDPNHLKTPPFLSTISVQHICDLNLIFDSQMKNSLIKKMLKNCILDDIEVIVLDTPPNITEEHLALANLIKPDLGILVTTPQTIAMNDVKRQLSFCNKIGISILGIIENMKDVLCGKCQHLNPIFSHSSVKEFCRCSQISYLGSIPLQIEIAKSSDIGKPVEFSIFDEISDLVISRI